MYIVRQFAPRLRRPRLSCCKGRKRVEGVRQYCCCTSRVDMDVFFDKSRLSCLFFGGPPRKLVQYALGSMIAASRRLYVRVFFADAYPVSTELAQLCCSPFRRRLFCTSSCPSLCCPPSSPFPSPPLPLSLSPPPSFASATAAAAAAVRGWRELTGAMNLWMDWLGWTAERRVCGEAAEGVRRLRGPGRRGIAPSALPHLQGDSRPQRRDAAGGESEDTRERERRRREWVTGRGRGRGGGLLVCVLLTRGLIPGRCLFSYPEGIRCTAVYPLGILRRTEVRYCAAVVARLMALMYCVKPLGKEAGLDLVFWPMPSRRRGVTQQ